MVIKIKLYQPVPSRFRLRRKFLMKNAEGIIFFSLNLLFYAGYKNAIDCRKLNFSQIGL